MAIFIPFNVICVSFLHLYYFLDCDFRLHVQKTLLDDFSDDFHIEITQCKALRISPPKTLYADTARWAVRRSKPLGFSVALCRKSKRRIAFYNRFFPAKRRLLFLVSHKFSMKYNAISSPCTESFNLQQTTKNALFQVLYQTFTERANCNDFFDLKVRLLDAILFFPKEYKRSTNGN